MKNKEQFELPKAEVILFENEDVITTSGRGENEGDIVPANPQSLNYWAGQDDEE